MKHMGVRIKEEKHVNELIGNLNLGDKNFYDLTFLIDDKLEFDIFINNFWESQDRQFYAVSNFRQCKIRLSNIDITQFLYKFNNYPIAALEELFQHKVEKRDLQLLRKRIDESEITLSSLFYKHKADPAYRLKRFIL
jgi:hypothetical protein